MTQLDLPIFAVGWFLLTALLWRGLKKRLWKSYPFFYTYVLYVFVLNCVVLLWVLLRLPRYAFVYWWGAALADTLRFLVLWEILRQTFSVTAAVRRMAGQVVMIGLLFLSVSSLLLRKNLTQLFRPESFFPALERELGLVQALFLLTCLLLARYYDIPLGRNLWGMAFGFGLYLSLSVINMAVFELTDSFLPFWRYTRALSFIGMVGMWIWALWVYAPSPKPRSLAPGDMDQDLRWWKHAWGKMQHSLRKASGL